MPLLILRPDLRMTFLDALQKRITFLEDALARLGLSATTLHARAEDAAHMEAHRERYDAAVSRAVASCAVNVSRYFFDNCCRAAMSFIET